MSKPTISKLKKKLMEIVKQHVRERDQNTDQRTGEVVYGSNCHCSHIMPVSSGNALAFCPLNMKILSYHNHLNWWHKNPLEATEWFKSKFPGRYAYLMKHRNDKVHWKLYDYEEMIKLAQADDWEAYHRYILKDDFDEK